MLFESRAWRAAAACAALFVAAAGAAQAQTGDCLVNMQGKTVCPPAKSVCLADRNGVIKCSPRDGGIVADRYGALSCGAGRCMLDFHGEPVCSKEPGGAAAIDMSSVAVCTGGCEKAQAARCTTLTP